MLRKTMVVLAALLAVGLGQMLPGGPVAVPGQGILMKPGPVPGQRSDGGTDAGYILQAIVAGGNGTMYGPAGYGGYSMGFRFTPLTSGAITKIGRYRGSYNETSTCKLWDAANGDQLASASVSGSDWSYVDITPVMVESGHEYYVTTYGGSYVYYYYLSAGIPFDMNDVRLLYGAYYYGDGMPNSNGGTYIYGCADFYFEPWPSTENWTGAVSTDWAADGNWDGGHAPAAGITVNIPGGCSNYPTTNSGSSYGAKKLDIAEGASLTIVSGKPLTLTGAFTNAGTFQADGNVTCKAGVLNNAGGEFTISTGATFNCAGDLYNAGTMTNGGYMYFPKNFTNGGTFTSGTYSELHFTGSSDATFDGGSTDAGSGLYSLFVEKVPLNVKVGDSAIAWGTYFGNAYFTQLCENNSTMAGDISSWKCYCYSSGTIRARIYRAGYNGYDWGMVTQGANQSCVSGLNEFTETLSGVEVGDKLGAYDGGPIAFGYQGGHHMLIYMGDANPGANGWYDWDYGPYALEGYMQGPAGDLTTSGDVAIAGDLMINDGNDLVVSGSSHYTASGFWTDNGMFHPGAGTVTFDVESQIAGTAAHEFNNLEITGTLYGPSAMTVNGNWTCSGTFDNGSGTVTMKGGSITSGGQPFSKLIIDNASDGNVTITDDITVTNTLTLTNGNFRLGPHTLTLGTTSAAGTALVNGGLFSVKGTSAADRGKVTAAAAGRPYAFTVNTGAKIASMYASFNWMGANGIDVKSGATIDATDNFSWTSFTPGNTVGTMLKVGNGQTLDDIMYTDFNGTAGSNIDYSAGTGHMTVSGGIGALWGEDFDNDPSNKVDWVVLTIHDVGVSAILAPANTVGEHIVLFPKVTVKNYGEVAEDFDVRVIISDATDAEVYNHVEHVTGLAIGETRNFSFTANSWDPTPQGSFHVLAKTELGGDAHPENNMSEQDFVVGPPYPAGWAEVADIPIMPSGRAIKDGGALAYDAGTDAIYASKGYKTGDFYKYEVSGDWTILSGVPFGGDGKQVYKGSVICADGNGKIYLVKGNNTMGFWEYDAATNVWTQMSNVPYGESGKKVKKGTGIAWAQGAAYLLKGYRNEFYKYDPAAGWITLTPAPIGWHKKWDAGSWLVSDGDHTLYAFKGKYHEFYAYDTETGEWSTFLRAMPIPGNSGNKKAKDGSSAAWFEGDIYAFKGGNTTEFWKYFTSSDSWVQQADIPLYGNSGRRKKVKQGGALAGYPSAGGLYALKGNKTYDFWRYAPYMADGAQPSREGVMASNLNIGDVSFAIAPNPLSGGLATVRYSLPKAGLATLYVYDVTGRTVLTQTLAAGRTGTAGLDLRKLDAGVYLVKVAAEGFSTTQKLVVQH